jgi:hypothetical protein
MGTMPGLVRFKEGFGAQSFLKATLVAK